MKVEELEKQLKQGILKSIYLLYGEEKFLLETSLKLIVKNFGSMMVLIHFLHSLYKEERNFSLHGIQSIFHQSTCQSYNAKIADFHEAVLPGPTDLPSLVFCVASFPLSFSI